MSNSYIFRQPIPFSIFAKDFSSDAPIEHIEEQYERYLDAHEIEYESYIEGFYNYIESFPDDKMRSQYIDSLKSNEKIARRIKNARNRLKLTQIESASLLDISKQSIYNYEKGYSVPTQALFEKMAKLYSVDTTELTSGFPDYSTAQNEQQHRLSEIEKKIDLISNFNYDEYASAIEKANGHRPSEREALIDLITLLLQELSIEQLYEMRKNTILNSILNLKK